ncbi:hypothetical protein LINPERHAP1_LOCUS41953 [Linum perenne]
MRISRLLLVFLLVIAFIVELSYAGKGGSLRQERMNVMGHVIIDVQRLTIGSHVCFSAKSAAKHACVFHQGRMGIRRSALATTTGKPKKANLNALEPLALPFGFSNLISLLILDLMRAQRATEKFLE